MVVVVVQELFKAHPGDNAEDIQYLLIVLRILQGIFIQILVIVQLE